MQLTEHFTLEELTRSGAAEKLDIDNDPSPEVGQNLVFLCRMILEPVREMLGCPLSVSSGYRCPEVNAAVGGEPTSQHVKGEACDFTPEGLSLVAAFIAVAASHDIPFDQLIREPNWIHVSYNPGGNQRRQCLIKEDGQPYRTYAPR